MKAFESSFGTEFYPSNKSEQPCFGMTIPEKQFKRSQNTGPHFGVPSQKQKLHIKQFQFQQKIVLLKIQIKLQALVDTFHPKVHNTKLNVFQKLKSLQNPEQVIAIQRQLCILTVDNIFNRIASFVKLQRAKLLSKAFTQIILRGMLVSKIEFIHKNKRKTTDKRDSELVRVNSNFDENSMHVSDLIADGQVSCQLNAVNSKAKNSQLKKQKQKIDQNHNYLFAQFQQILAPHQQYLKKR